MTMTHLQAIRHLSNLQARHLLQARHCDRERERLRAQAAYTTYLNDRNRFNALAAAQRRWANTLREEAHAAGMAISALAKLK